MPKLHAHRRQPRPRRRLERLPHDPASTPAAPHKATLLTTFAARQLQAAAATTARLKLQTNVLGAAVELEPERGVATGSGFVVDVLVDAGERRVSMSKPGFETRTLVLMVEPGEVRALRVDLDKAAAGRSDTSSGRLRWSRLERANGSDG